MPLSRPPAATVECGHRPLAWSTYSLSIIFGPSMAAACGFAQHFSTFFP